MPQTLALGVVAAAALLASGLTIYFWRKSTGLYALLVEGANRFEELRTRNSQLEQAVAKSDEKIKGHRDAAARLDKGLAESREKAADLLQKLEAKQTEAKLMAEKLELQKSFLEKQLAKAQEQLRLSEEQGERWKAERDELEQKLQRAVGDADRASAISRQEIQLKERELITKNRDLEKTIETLRKKFEAVDPIEIKKVRRKTAQYERLYNSMKGLREMTEERNYNYEVALRKLSAWIITKTHGAARVPQAIGPLVGRALEVIGAQLIDDHEMPTRPGAGASLATSMDDIPSMLAGRDDDPRARLARATDAEAAALEAENEAERRS